MNQNQQTADRPLVSFCLMAFNQEAYIEEAFKSALAQDYSPLEVVVSDDCSRDRTWEILQKVAKEYRDEHKVILHRNETNLGTIRNWEMLCSLAHGELLIKADGDDISLSCRASVLVKEYLVSGAVVLASSYLEIDKNGQSVGEKTLPDGDDSRSIAAIANGVGYCYLGATLAIHRSLYDEFPAVRHTKSSDCAVYEARGLYCRSFYDEKHPLFRAVGKPLVLYRLGSGDTTGGAYRKFMLKGITRSLEARKQILLDLEETARQYLPDAYYQKLHQIYQNYKQHLEYCVSMWGGGTYMDRLRGYRNVGDLGGFFSKARMVGRILLLPPWCADFLFSILRKIKH